jgi:hypothetical protein
MNNTIIDDDGFPHGEEEEGEDDEPSSNHHDSYYDDDEEEEEEEEYYSNDDEDEDEDEDDGDDDGRSEASYERESYDDDHSFEGDDEEELVERQDDDGYSYPNDDPRTRHDDHDHYGDHYEDQDDSYETETQYDDDDEEEETAEEEDDDEEHDDIQSSMTPYEPPPKKYPAHPVTDEDVRHLHTPTREEDVAKVRVGYPTLVNNQPNDIPKTSRSTVSSSSSRGRSPTPKKQLPPQYDQQQRQVTQSEEREEERTSRQTPWMENSTLDPTISEMAMDSIQTTIRDASTSFQEQHHHQQQQQQHPPLSPTKEESSYYSNSNLNGSRTTTTTTTTTVNGTPVVSPRASPPVDTRSQKSLPAASSSSHSLKRRSSHRKPASALGAPRISWKSDPIESFSDWSVKICHDGMMVAIYHVHRNIVGYGSRKSDFFLKEFQKQQQQQQQQNAPLGVNETLISLPAALAKVFPMVLDFIYYTKEAKQTLTAERACNVFKLSETLEIPALQNAIAEFYAKNLSLKNLGEFLWAASKAKADRLLIVSKAKIGQLITEKPELSGLVPPKFMADILLISHRQLVEARSKEPNKFTDELVQSQSRYWSKAACICADHNETELTSKLFQDLTSEESLPYIDASVAPKLLLMDAKFNKPADQQRNDETTFSSLQRRCIDSITDDLQDFQKGFTTPEACSRVLRELPSIVLAEILMKKMTFS